MTGHQINTIDSHNCITRATQAIDILKHLHFKCKGRDPLFSLCNLTSPFFRLKFQFTYNCHFTLDNSRCSWWIIKCVCLSSQAQKVMNKSSQLFLPPRVLSLRRQANRLIECSFTSNVWNVPLFAARAGKKSRLYKVYSREMSKRHFALSVLFHLSSVDVKLTL